ncbi:MAG: deoxycytidylate deaminase [Variovorax paradoxus]|nr:MAG: deoxycytidylate deaminase [Variovorax paradoxus]PZQ09614.1 MAG: deoxycytidylate deaminase [Variovorax paradoxus]
MALPAEIAKDDVRPRKPVRLLFNALEANELIFAVVGPVGSGTSFVANALSGLVSTNLNATNIIMIKASDIISAHLGPEVLAQIPKEDKLARAMRFQDAGDQIREGDEARLAAMIASKIKKERAKIKAPDIHDAKEKSPPTVYIIDSLKHPTEVELLRGIYREAFCLIGVVCEEKTRKARLQEEKCRRSTPEQVERFMSRDEDEDLAHGQKVSSTFHLADFFVDNTPSRLDADGAENPDWIVNEKLGRLIDILSGTRIIRPEAAETGMFHAKGAQLKSSCLSRQVGASLMDARGTVISTGTNEVPMAGGGLYGSGVGSLGHGSDDEPDHRCFRTNKYCSNTKTQQTIISEIIESIPELKNSANQKDIQKQLKSSALGRLLEFSRAVHAEMDALLTAARDGSSTVGTKMFVTTYPCHYCARHIVTAGVEEVQYIEPYPKSRATELHKDAIQVIAAGWRSPAISRDAKVLFRPFTGVSPRLYRRAFLKDRRLKNSEGDLEVGRPLWATGLLRESYTSIEDYIEST